MSNTNHSITNLKAINVKVKNYAIFWPGRTKDKSNDNAFLYLLSIISCITNDPVIVGTVILTGCEDKMVGLEGSVLNTVLTNAVGLVYWNTWYFIWILSWWICWIILKLFRLSPWSPRALQCDTKILVCHIDGFTNNLVIASVLFWHKHKQGQKYIVKHTILIYGNS